MGEGGETETSQVHQKRRHQQSARKSEIPGFVSNQTQKEEVTEDWGGKKKKAMKPRRRFCYSSWSDTTIGGLRGQKGELIQSYEKTSQAWKNKNEQCPGGIRDRKSDQEIILEGLGTKR